MISIEKIGKTFGTERLCNETLTMNEFKACVENSRNMVKIVDEEITTDIDWYSIYHMVEPKNGFIRFDQSDTIKLYLSRSNQYHVTLFDRNFLLRSNNPEVVTKNGITINEKAWAPIYIKVHIT